MKKLLGIVVLGLLLSSCASTPQTQISKSAHEVVFPGMTKEQVCKLNWNDQFNIPGSDRLLCHIYWEKHYIYKPELKTEIIWNGQGKVFFVFENVNQPMDCTGLFRCNHGDGTLKKIVYTMEMAQEASDPKLAKAGEERRKKAAEKDRKRKIEEEKDRKRKVEEEKKKKKIKATKKPVASSGSAFFIDNKGHLVTNFHVVEKCYDQSKIIYKKKEYEAKLIAKDTLLDLALLKAEVQNNKFIMISSKPPKKLKRIIAAGYPYGKELSDDLKFNSGIITSLKGLGDDSTRLQIDAALNRGNSGGPIVYEENGQLAAVAVAGLRKDVTESINFGIKGSSLRNFLEANQLNLATIAKKFNFDDEDLAELLEASTIYTFCK